jgi:hypothetical protein
VLSGLLAWPGRQPAVYVFVLWSEARREQTRILSDLASRFTVLDLAEVTWTAGETFAENLSRFYGDALPTNSAKEVHCGSGPFISAVIEDRNPRYRPRRTTRGVKLVNSSVFDARRRYRDWTGGGFRVHASDSLSETRRNVSLLFGTRVDDFRGRRGAVGGVMRRVESDLAGAAGWTSRDELVTVLEAHKARVSQRSGQADHFDVVASDIWWIELIVGGDELRPRVRQVRVGSELVVLSLHETVAGRARTALAPLRATVRPLRRRLRSIRQLVRWQRR